MIIYALKHGYNRKTGKIDAGKTRKTTKGRIPFIFGLA
jgi:hypothetical protein